MLIGLTRKVRALTLKEKIAKKERLILDGGMGSQLINYPEYSGKDPSLLNITHPEIIRAVHKSYVDAGSQLIIANTFDVNPKRYENYAEIIAAAIENAKVAGAPYVGLDIGPIGELMYPMGQLKPETAYEYFEAVVKEGVKCGADFIIIETMIDQNEMKEALSAAKNNSSLPVIVSCAYGKRGRLMTTGGKPEDVVAIAESLGADAVGANCSFGPDLMIPIIETYKTLTDLPIWAKPNAGLPQVVDGKPVYTTGVEEFKEYMKQIEKIGATMIGGCCGTTPKYIEAIK